MPIALHPDAKQKFDERGSGLAAQLPPNNPPRHRTPAYTPDVPVAGHIDEQDIIGSVVQVMTDRSGNAVGRAEHGTDFSFVVEGPAYEELRKLASSMHATKTLRDVTTRQSLEAHVFTWLRDRVRSNLETSLTDYVEAELNGSVQEMTVLVQVPGVFIEIPFDLGRVSFRQITSADTQASIDHWADFHKMPKSEAEVLVTHQRKEWQGRTTAAMQLVADEDRASEVVVEETERSLAVLRLFAEGMFEPTKRCYCSVVGDNQPNVLRRAVVTGGVIVKTRSQALDLPDASWTLTADVIRRYVIPVSKPFSQLLKKDELSDFEERILRSIQVYSRAALSANVSEKLIHVMVSLEALLNKNESEPIQANIAERIAFVVGPDLNARKEIKGVVLKAYGIRSRYLHHARQTESPDELATLREFMQIVWRFFQLLPDLADKYTTKDAFIAALEDRKLA